MPSLEIKDRKLTAVRLLQTSLQSTALGLEFAFGCELQIQSEDGGNDGPVTIVWSALPYSPESTFLELEHAALKKAGEIIRLLGGVGPEEISQTFASKRERDLTSAKEAAKYFSNSGG